MATRDHAACVTGWTPKDVSEDARERGKMLFIYYLIVYLITKYLELSVTASTSNKSN